MREMIISPIMLATEGEVEELIQFRQQILSDHEVMIDMSMWLLLL